MKSLLTIVFLSLFLSLNAQVWIDQGATWHYNYIVIGDGGFTKLEYSEDTIVDGITCQKIDYTRSHFMYNQNNDIVSLGESSGISGITYVSGDTVFYRRNETFFMLYDFGAQVGDSWIIDTTTIHPNNLCGDTSRVEVVATGVLQINGVDYRTITLETTDDSPYFLEGTFVERFGLVNSYGVGHMLFPRQNSCDVSAIFEYYIFTFKCFQDNSMPLYIPSGGSCEYSIGMEEKRSSELVELYPNPVQNELTIKQSIFTNSKIVRIVNVMGQEVCQYSIDSNVNKIDLSTLKKGVYFIIFDNGITRKIVKQ